MYRFLSGHLNRSLIIYLIALVAFCITAGCSDSPTAQDSPEWTAVVPSLEGHDFRGVTFLSADTAFLCGVDGAILRTTDAGRTWSTMPTGIISTLSDIDFADNRHGWEVGDDGSILRTTNGGQLWQGPFISPTTAALKAITAVTPRKAVVIGADSTCYFTVDGGFRWEILGDCPEGNWHDILVLDTTAVAIGDRGLISRFSGYNRIVEKINIDTLSRNPLVTDTTYHTVDTLWSRVDIIPPVVDETLLAIADGGDGVLWAVGEQGTVVLSGDGGLTWEQIPSGTSTTLTDIAITGSTGVIVGFGGAKLITDNSGFNWTGIPSDISLDLYCAAVPTNGALWAFGSFTILRSDDAGFAWERLTSSTTLAASLTDVEFIDDTLGFAVGYNNTILRTTDGGAVWRLLQQGSKYNPTVWLSAVDFVDPLHGWAVGRTGRPPYSLVVVRTTDGGDSWRSFTFLALPWAEDVSFVDIMTGYVCSFGAVLKTTDGGENWEVQPLPVPASLTAIEFVDPQCGLAVGAGGAIMRTDDGTVWENRSSDTLIVTLQGLDYVNPLLGYAVGALGSVWKTVDGGVSWQALDSPTSASLVAVHFSDAAHGTAVGANGTIITTSDGGKSWVLERSPTALPLLGVCMTAPGSGWIVGEGGTILARTSSQP